MILQKDWCASVPLLLVSNLVMTQDVFELALLLLQQYLFWLSLNWLWFWWSWSNPGSNPDSGSSYPLVLDWRLFFCVCLQGLAPLLTVTDHFLCVWCAQRKIPRAYKVMPQDQMRHVNDHCTSTRHILQFSSWRWRRCHGYWIPLNKHMANIMAKSCRHKDQNVYSCATVFFFPILTTSPPTSLVPNEAVNL